MNADSRPGETEPLGHWPAVDPPDRNVSFILITKPDFRTGGELYDAIANNEGEK